MALNEIGKRIGDLRDYRNMTKRELASRLDISESQLSRIESGKTATISSDILIGLAKEFDVSADYILGLSPPNPTITSYRSCDCRRLPARS